MKSSTRAQIQDVLFKTVAKFAPAAPDSLTIEADLLEDLLLDSLQRLEIVSRLSDAYGLSIETKDLAGLRTLQDIVDYVARRKGIE